MDHMDDTSDAPIHRIVIRVVVPPDASAVLPLPDIKRRLERDGLVVVGMGSGLEDERAPSDPSILV